MKAELKHIHSPDFNIMDYRPEVADSFSFYLEAMIGPEGSDAKELFDFVVCTPLWLLENCQAPMWGRHMIIVPSYDIDKVWATIAHYCSTCEGKDWDAIARRLSRIGHWEFEDYKANPK